MKEFERKFYITTLWSIALEIFMAPTYDLYLIIIVGKKACADSCGDSLGGSWKGIPSIFVTLEFVQEDSFFDIIDGPHSIYMY